MYSLHRYSVSKRRVLTLFLLAICILLTIHIINSKTSTKTTNNDYYNNNYFHKSAKNIAIIQKTQLFPQGGGNVKFDQPWALPHVHIVEELAELENTPQRYIISNFSYSPGLGNLMFQYASLKAISIRYGARLLVPNDCKLRRAFHLDAIFITENLNNLLLSKFDSAKYNFKECCRFYGDVLENLFQKSSQQKFELLMGYFQAFPYFHPDQEPLIREQFAFLPQILAQAYGFIEEVKYARLQQNISNQTNLDGDLTDGLSLIYVGIHIRHGMDITLNSRNIKHGHTVATKEYFQNAMNYFRNKFDNLVFVIASDNQQWAKANIIPKQKGEVFFLKSNYRELDLAVLTLCNHTIMSTGTFSWWAAYLSDRNRSSTIIYYGDWPRPGSVLDSTVNKTEFFLQNWIAMR